MCCLEQCRHISNGRCRQAGAVSWPCIRLAGVGFVIALVSDTSILAFVCFDGGTITLDVQGVRTCANSILGCSCCHTSQVLTSRCWTYFASSKAGTALFMSSTGQNTSSMATLAGGTIPAALLTKKIQKTQKTSVLLFVLFCNQITDTRLAGQAVSAA